MGGAPDVSDSAVANVRVAFTSFYDTLLAAV